MGRRPSQTRYYQPPCPSERLDVTRTPAERGTVEVVAALTTKRCVRVARATVETPQAADNYIKDLQARHLCGLDPLAGMDPVMTHPTGEPHAVGRHYSDRKRAEQAAFAAKAQAKASGQGAEASVA